MHATVLASTLIPFSFRTLFFWYFIAILLEFIFPGLVSNYLSLDNFLWLVIIAALLSFIIEKKR